MEDDEILGGDEIELVDGDILDDDEDTQDEADTLDTEDTEDKPDQEKESETENQPETEQPEKTEQNPAVPTSFKVKHLGEEKEVSFEDAPTWIQKGLDYDRIKPKYEQLKSQQDPTNSFKAWLDDLAQINGVTPDALKDQINQNLEEALAQRIVEKEGIDFKTALRQVQLDRKEKALKTAEEAEAKRKADADAETKKAAERRDAETDEFLKAHPDVDPTKIPQEVWDATKSGRSLLNAYDAWDLKQQKAKHDAEVKNFENKQKSTGSKQSAGNKAAGDKDFEGFGD